MTTYSGTTRASANNLADVRKVGTSTIAVVATGEIVHELRAALEAPNGLKADHKSSTAGEFAIIERGAAFAYVRASTNAVVIFRDAKGHIDTVNGDRRTCPLEMVGSAVLVVGVPQERLQRSQLEKWLKRGATDEAIDRLVAAWGDHAVVVIESWKASPAGRPRISLTGELDLTAATSQGVRPKVDTDAATPMPHGEREEVRERDGSYGTIPPPAMMMDDQQPMPTLAQEVASELRLKLTPELPSTSTSSTTPLPQEVSEIRAGDDQRLVAALVGATVVLVVFLILGIIIALS